MLGGVFSNMLLGFQKGMKSPLSEAVRVATKPSSHPPRIRV